LDNLALIFFSSSIDSLLHSSGEALAYNIVISAFDVLMSNASAKKKRKLEETVDTPPTRVDDKTLVLISDSKKPKSDRVTKLKSKIGLLKKKPSDFDPEKCLVGRNGREFRLCFSP